MAAPLVINRRIWAWSSQELSLIRNGAAEEIITPVRSIDYDDGSSPAVVMASGYYPHGVSDGQYVPGSMSIGLLAQYARELLRRITNNGEVEASSVDLRILIKMRARGTDVVIADEIDFRILSLSDSRKTGDGAPIESQLACLPILIKRDGVVI